MRFISLFAGIGGFDLALLRHGHRCVWANEWDPYAAKIYDKNFRPSVNTQDIRGIKAGDLPECDLIVGGFPCQAFSIAGKRRGFLDTRGTLFFEIARLLAEKRPRLVLLENVKGLLSHQGGKTFRTIIDTLDELGYDLQWQVLNSKDFGVPQNRERVYIIGNLRGQPRPEVFPIRPIEDVLESRQPTSRQTTATALRAKQGGPDIDQTYVALTEIRSEEAKRIRREMRRQGRDWSPRRSKEIVERTDGLMGTLTSSRNLENIVAKGTKIRRLTPTECERLQGFPDGWTKGISDTQRYKCLGNAVTVNVVEAIVKKI